MNVFPTTIFNQEFNKLCYFTNITTSKARTYNLKKLEKHKLITINEQIVVNSKGGTANQRYELTNQQDMSKLKVESPCLHRDFHSIIFFGYQADLAKIIHYINTLPKAEWLNKIMNSPDEIRYEELVNRVKAFTLCLRGGIYKKENIFDKLTEKPSKKKTNKSSTTGSTVTITQNTADNVLPLIQIFPPTPALPSMQMLIKFGTFSVSTDENDSQSSIPNLLNFK